ncbi:hypothetical protein Tco_0020599 [Tanacetum coccineum]
MNGPYVRRMIPEPAEIKQMEAGDQEIQTILLGLPEDIYAAVDKKKAKLFNEWERFTSTDGESIESYYHRFSNLMNDFKRNKHFPKKIASNLKFLNNLQPEWSRHVTIVHQTKDLHTTDYTQLYEFLKYNQKEVDELRAERRAKSQDPLALMANSNNSFKYLIAQPSMNLGQDNQMRWLEEVGGIILDSMLDRIEGIRGLGHLVRNCTVRPRRRDAAYLQTQLLIAQKEEAGIQLQAEEFDLMAAAVDLDEIEEVNANYILMANLQQASTSGTQSDNAPVYDTNGSAEVQLHENFYNNEIFNMFTQEEQYTELLEPIPEPHQVPQNDSNVIYEVCSVEQGGGTVEQHSANVKETHAYHESLFHNLAAKVEKVNLVNRKMKEKNAELTTELSRYKNQERHSIFLANEADESLAKHKALELEIERLLRAVVNQDIMSIVQNNSVGWSKFVQDFQPLANEADKSLGKHKAVELEIERLLRAVVNQDIMSIVQNNSVVDTSNLQTKLDQCKYDKFHTIKLTMTCNKRSNDCKLKLGDQKGKSKDTPCVSDTLDPLFQKHENENVELKFQIRNYEKENAHLMAVYKNLFDSINVTRTQTKPIIDSLQNKLHDMIYENAKLRAQLFDKVSEQKDTTRGTSANTKFAKQSILGKPPSSSRPKTVCCPLST